MIDAQDKDDRQEIEVLPGNVPVTMPELPIRHTIKTMQELKAFSDPVRERIMGILQHQPASAKQLADRLNIAPGTIGHHMQVLEEAGLIKLVARRLIRGIVAKYYTRSAYIFIYDLPPEISGSNEVSAGFANQYRDEILDTSRTIKADPYHIDGFLHPRLSPERAAYWQERIRSLTDELIQEKPDPNGTVYSIFISMFTSPTYRQVPTTSTEEDTE